MLVDVTQRQMGTTVLGEPVSMPILIASTAFQGLAHPEGEVATTKAAGAAKTVMTLATCSTSSIEEAMAVATGPVWFQLYVFKDRAITASLVQRAEEAGCKAIVLTVDVPVLGKRERDVRNRFTLPDSLSMKNLLPGGCQELPKNVAGSGLAAYVASLFATISILPEIVDAMGGKVEVYVDGGIRRGTDVLKAIACGARAVFIGRPVLWGLACGGEAGVGHVLQMMRQEFDLAMALSGCPTLSSITRDLIRRL